MIEPAAVQDLMGRWWFNYDEGRFAELDDLLTDDADFTARSDTGATAYEEFVTSDLRGREQIVAWQTQHRTASPYPLRHNLTNLHVTEPGDREASFASYLFVTQIVDGSPSNLSTAISRGRVRAVDGTLRIAELHVVLDTMTSITFAELPPRV